MHHQKCGNMIKHGNLEYDRLGGRYRILSKLGEGGMGAVWCAEDAILDLRKVAIKTLPLDLLDDRIGFDRLKKEAQISLQLSHPNLAAVRSFEVHNGMPYLVMDYVEGQTLAKHIYQHGPTADIELFEIFAPLASALDYAHSMGVIHRDIKPSNIMLKKDGNPVLLDFGISSELRSVLYRNGYISGTLPYMSPEQLNGDPPSKSQDIYSLAVSAYECLTGRPPFYLGDIANQIMHCDRPPLDCKCWFCIRVQFGIGLNTSLRPKSAVQIANAESRLRSFTRWVLKRTEYMLSMSIQDDPIAISRLEEAAQVCLQQLGKQQKSTINLPFLHAGKHILFTVSRNDIRALHW